MCQGIEQRQVENLPDIKRTGVQRLATPRIERERREPLHPGGPPSPLAWRDGSSVSPGAGHEARLPVRQKPYCEAPTGVADPITTWSSEVVASTQEGG